MPEPAPGTTYTPDQLTELTSPKLAAYLERTATGNNYTPNQRLLAAGLARSHDAYFFSELVTAYLGVGAGVLSGSVVIFAAFWLVSRTRLDFVLYVLAAALVGFLYLVPKASGSRTIYFKRDKEGKIDTLWLGLLSEVINPGVLMGMIFLMATGMATQTALLRFTSNHLDVPAATSVWSAFLMTLKTVLHIPLDLLELYVGPVGGPKAESPSIWSATVLNFFRVVYDGLIGVALYSTYQRWRIRKLYRTHPRSGSVEDLLAWMEQISRDKANWGRMLHDEMVFNMIAEEYLRGNYDVVRKLARQFVSIDVANEVRQLFVDPRTGELLFELREEKEGGKKAAAK